MNYLRILLFTAFLNTQSCTEKPTPKIDESLYLPAPLKIDSNKNTRSIKIFFQQESIFGISNDVMGYKDFKLKIDKYELDTKRKDTISLDLPFRNLDTLWAKMDGENEFRISRLLKFKDGEVYEWRVNSCSGIDYFSTKNKNNDTIQPAVSFLIKNNNSKGRIIGVRGLNGTEFGDEAETNDLILFLKSNQKTPYKNVLSISAMCSTGSKRIAIDNLDKTRVFHYDNGKSDFLNYTYTEFWFEFLHNEKLDVTYDFKTKKATIDIVE
jgi:hypothetical protein